MKKNLFIFLAALTLNNASKAPSAADCLRLGLRASENFTVSAVACSTAANLFKKDTTTKNLLFNLLLSGLGAELCIPALWEESGKATNKKCSIKHSLPFSTLVFKTEHTLIQP